MIKSYILENGDFAKNVGIDTVAYKGEEHPILETQDGQGYIVLSGTESLDVVGTIEKHAGKIFYLYAHNQEDYQNLVESMSHLFSGEYTSKAASHHCYKGLFFNITDGLDIEIDYLDGRQYFNIDTDLAEIHAFIDYWLDFMEGLGRDEHRGVTIWYINDDQLDDAKNMLDTTLLNEGFEVGAIFAHANGFVQHITNVNNGTFAGVLNYDNGDICDVDFKTAVEYVVSKGEIDPINNPKD